jgi:hypothetical protein
VIFININVDEQILKEYDINPEEIKEYLKGFIMFALQSGLNLSSVKTVNFLYDFSNGLIKFQQENGLNVGFTNDVDRGYGKVEEIINGDSKEYYVFYDYSQLIFSLAEDEQIRNRGFNSLFHELCHVHDGDNLFPILKNNLVGKGQFNLGRYLDNVLYQISLSLWEEYFAHRISMEVFPIDTEIINLKRDMLDKEVKINNISPRYEIKVYQELHKYVEKLVRAIGDFHGGQGKEDELFESIDGTIVYRYFYKLSEQLKDLYNIYPNWNDYKVLLELAKIIKSIWEELDFNIIEVGNDFYLTQKTKD